MLKFIKSFGLIFITLLLIAGALSYSPITKTKPEQVGIGKLVEEINGETVKSVTVQVDTLFVTLNDEKAKPQEVKKELGQSFSELMSNYGVASEKLQKVDVQVKDLSGWRYWLVFAIFIAFDFVHRDYLFYDPSSAGRE